MNDRSDTDELPPADEPRTLAGYGFGLLAGAGFAVVYGLLAELLGLSWGLLAVGFFGGWAIGGAVAYGAWTGRAHVGLPRLQVGALAIGASAWLLALVVAYVVSQVLLPQASTPLLERLSLSGLITYLGGTFDFVGLIHLLALALLAFMAWRGAR